ncbi:hypothetical protein [Streptomyces sp. bgisy060]|uniref:hypothetical protein n=1 Tax=Streptomyces sp. bgisy060 TaxID=3413775 RepID=UPI003EB7FBDD
MSTIRVCPPGPSGPGLGGPGGDAVADLLTAEVLVEAAGVAFARPEPFGGESDATVTERLDQLGVELVESGGVAVPSVDEH